MCATTPHQRNVPRRVGVERCWNVWSSEILKPKSHIPHGRDTSADYWTTWEWHALHCGLLPCTCQPCSSSPLPFKAQLTLHQYYVKSYANSNFRHHRLEWDIYGEDSESHAKSMCLQTSRDLLEDVVQACGPLVSGHFHNKESKQCLILFSIIYMFRSLGNSWNK